MQEHIEDFASQVGAALQNLPINEIAKAMNILQAVYEHDGRIYVLGNGGSLAIATHWVSDFNKTVFSHHLGKQTRRFQAIRVPTTESELTAWANDVGFNMVFAGPLKNYLQDNDVVIAISSSGNSPNVVQAVKLAKDNHIPVIGLSGFRGGKLNKMADAKILVRTPSNEYELVESVHGTIMHLITRYFKDFFDYSAKKSKS